MTLTPAHTKVTDATQLRSAFKAAAFVGHDRDSDTVAAIAGAETAA